MTVREIPASVSQRLLWMIRHYRAGYGALNCPLLCRLSGPLDTGALRAALAGLTTRHEALRTTFTGRGAGLRQLVHPGGEPPLTIVDLPAGAEGERRLDQAISAELGTPVDPERWPTRATLWRTGPDRAVLCLTIHHLCTDAWSTGILLRDLAALYERAITGAGQPGPAGWPYARFAQWQAELLRDGRLDRHRRYWQRELAGAQLPALLPPARPGEAGAARPTPGKAAADVPRAGVAALRALARERQTTLFTVLLAAFHATLSGTTGQRELAVASMFANRSRPELRETVGLLANMVLLRASLAPGLSFADLVAQVHGRVIGAFAYQDLPLQMLPSDAIDTRGRRPDDVVFNMMADLRHVVRGGGVDFELMVPEEIGSRFRFELAVVPVGAHDLRCVLFHAGDSLSGADAEAFVRGYVELLTTVAAAPYEPLGRLLSGARGRLALAA